MARTALRCGSGYYRCVRVEPCKPGTPLLWPKQWRAQRLWALILAIPTHREHGSIAELTWA
jgi:hypothetical protein